MEANKPKVLRFEPLFGLSLPGSGGRPGPNPSTGARFQTEPAILARIARNVGGHAQVMVKVTSWGNTASRAKGHLDYITRNGRCPAENELGQPLEDAGAVRFALRGWFLEQDPKPHARKTLHMVLSMPAGTDAQKVLEGVRRFARDEFDGRQYFIVLHSTETDPRHGHPKHPHVHLQVKSLNDAGKRLRVGPADLWRYRQIFAEKMREQGIPANASGALERGVLGKRPKSRAAFERQAAQSDSRVQAALGKDLDFSLPVGNVGKLLQMARDDYRLVMGKLSSSQRQEDLKFAEAAMDWVRRFPTLVIHRDPLERRAEQLRASPEVQREATVHTPDRKQERSR